MPDKGRGQVRLGKRLREIQVKRGVYRYLLGKPRCTLGILHEHHCAHRRYGAAANAVQNLPRRLPAPPPIIGIDDQSDAGGLVALNVFESDTADA